jgi:hypothetical protein
MADRVLFISWGESIPGREAHGLEVFNETIGMYGRMQEEGRIESFDVVLCTPNADIDGYLEIRGSTEQMAALRESDEYLKAVMDAQLVVQKVRVAEGYTGAGLARVVSMYEQAIAAVPQPA